MKGWTTEQKIMCFPVLMYSEGVLTSKFTTARGFCMAKISWMKGKFKNGRNIQI
jgi:hypothetical protein